MRHARLLDGGNAYSGTTAVNGGMLQFAMPASLYAGNMGKLATANISVAGSTLAVNIGGPTDFTPAQAATLLTNLSASTSSSGLEANAAFGFDATNATGTVNLQRTNPDSTGRPVAYRRIRRRNFDADRPEHLYRRYVTVNAGTMIVTSTTGIEDGTNLTVGKARLFPAAAPCAGAGSLARPPQQCPNRARWHSLPSRPCLSAYCGGSRSRK